MRNIGVISVVFAMLVSSTASAQSTYNWPAPDVASTAPVQKFFLPPGTPLMLRTLTQVSTKDNKPGDRIYLEVAESVTFRGQVVIPIGAPVIGEVSRVERNGHFGKKGKLEIRLIRAETPNGSVRLNGSAYDEGRSGTAASFATIALVSGLGFLIHGTSGYLQPGTVVQAHLAEALRFAWQAPSERPATALQQVQPDPATPATPGFSTFGSNGDG